MQDLSEELERLVRDISNAAEHPYKQSILTYLRLIAVEGMPGLT